MVLAIFWISLLLIIYVYFLYPSLLFLMSNNPRIEIVKNETYQPSVSLIISAFNEENVIEAKLNNSLSLDYSREKLKIVVASDGSTDKTNSIVRRYSEKGVRLVDFKQNQGKLMALNNIVRKLNSEIIVFSDANSIYDFQAIKELVKYFADTKIGCVVGELRYKNPKQKAIGESEGLYWKYEQLIKRKESTVSSVVGANGSIFAMRRELYPFLDAHIINDFVHPLMVVKKGYRVLYEPMAKAYENTTSTEKQEFKRKVRIVNRSFNGIWHVRSLLNPFKFGVFSLQLWSHKLLRWFVPVFMLLVFISNLFLLKLPFYHFTFAMQMGFYMLALFDGIFGKRSKITYIPRYFCVVNYAALLGVSKAMMGTKISTWTPIR